jgi:hypothetical protein
MAVRVGVFGLSCVLIPGGFVSFVERRWIITLY